MRRLVWNQWEDGNLLLLHPLQKFRTITSPTHESSFESLELYSESSSGPKLEKWHLLWISDSFRAMEAKPCWVSPTCCCMGGTLKHGNYSEEHVMLKWDGVYSDPELQAKPMFSWAPKIFPWQKNSSSVSFHHLPPYLLQEADVTEEVVLGLPLGDTAWRTSLFSLVSMYRFKRFKCRIYWRGEGNKTIP